MAQSSQTSTEHKKEEKQLNSDKKICLSDYCLDFVIGKGGFGKVWKAEYKRNHQILAMKEMYKAKIIQKKSINSVMN